MSGLKATISFSLVVISQNVAMKRIIYDQVDREGIPALIFKTVQGSCSVFVGYKTLQCFNVSTTGIVCSLMPLIVLMMAACMLNEKVTRRDILMVMVIFTAVVLVILGAQGKERETMQSDWVAVSCLIIQPFMLAGGVIAMRRMKKMHSMVVSTYTNFFLMITSLIAIASTPGLDFTFLNQLNTTSWVMFCLVAGLTIGEQTTKFMALKY